MGLGLDCGLGCKYTIPHGSGSKSCQQDSNRTAFWSAKRNYSLLGQVDSHSGLDRSEFTYIQFSLSLGWVGGWLDLGPTYLSFILGINVVFFGWSSRAKKEMHHLATAFSFCYVVAWHEWVLMSLRWRCCVTKAANPAKDWHFSFCMQEVP